MSLLGDIVQAGHLDNGADLPSRHVAQAYQPPACASKPHGWRRSPGDLQHIVRELMLRASSPVPVSDGRDEVASLRKQLRHQEQAHHEMHTMLKNQALAIETFQNKWQMAGQVRQELCAFIAKTRSQKNCKGRTNRCTTI